MAGEKVENDMHLRKFVWKIGLSAGGWAAFAALGQGLTAQGVGLDSHGDASRVAEVGYAHQMDVSPPLRDIPASPRARGRFVRAIGPIPLPALPLQHDPMLQMAVSSSLATTAGVAFAGVGNGDYGFTPNAAPPDPNLAVGATQLVQWVNESFAVFEKSTGAIVAGFPKAGNTVWRGFGGGCETNNDGDPIIQYDKANSRWILTQFSVSTKPYLQCVAVSTSADATGTYNRYAFSYGATQFPDYPKLGVWPDGYYISFNIFNNGTSFAGSKVCAYDGARMRSGLAATQVCFQLSSSFGGLLPSDLDGSTAPPAGSPNYFMNFGTNSLNLWKFHVDFAVPGKSTLTGPTNVPVGAFTPACGGGTCIAQPNTSQQLDSLADRLMYRLAYRNRSGIESLVVNHSVKVSNNRRSQVVGIRWYEIRTPQNPKVYQQGTYSPDSTSRWMGSIAMDKAGNIAMGYSASSATVFPSLRYTGRIPTDNLGTMQAENIMQIGAGSQQSNLSRWGDYTALALDPVDDCTFWYTNEYLKASGIFNWSTRIGSFKFPGCS